jgi:hypothetical protein
MRIECAQHIFYDLIQRTSIRRTCVSYKNLYFFGFLSILEKVEKEMLQFT